MRKIVKLMDRKRDNNTITREIKILRFERKEIGSAKFSCEAAAAASCRLTPANFSTFRFTSPFTHFVDDDTKGKVEVENNASVAIKLQEMSKYCKDDKFENWVVIEPENPELERSGCLRFFRLENLSGIFVSVNLLKLRSRYSRRVRVKREGGILPVSAGRVEISEDPVALL